MSVISEQCARPQWQDEADGFGFIRARLNTVLLVGLLVLSGCSASSDSADRTVSWRCQEVSGGLEPRCELTRMVNGRPVAIVEDTETDTKTHGEAEAKPDLSQGGDDGKLREIIPLGEYRRRTWKQQLPGLTVDKPDPKAVPQPAAYRDRPAPVPEAAFSDDEDGLELDAGGSGSLPAQAKPDHNDSISNPSINTDVVTENAPEPRRLTVQLGAFNTEQAANKFIQTHRLAHLNIETQTRRHGEQLMYVLIFGDFADQHSARKAWLAAAENAEQVEIWIRPKKP